MKKNIINFGLGTLLMLVFSMFFASSASAAPLTRQLEVGSRGNDVSSLQAFLAQDTSVYPQGLVTGYFGPLTQAAVSRYQAKNGLPSVGRVGPLTLATINSQMGGGTVGTGFDVAAPSIFNVSLTGSTGNTGTTTSSNVNVHWDTSEMASGNVYYSIAPMAMSDTLNSVTISGTPVMTDTGLRTTQNVSISGLQSNATYYYVIYTKDPSGNIQITWPSTFHTQ
jgi:hypothetical protein